MKILEARSLSKIYGEGDTAVNAVDDMTVAFNKGVFTAIVGASGSGKSTLLQLLGGVDKPTKGSVYLEGKDIYKLSDEKLSILRRRKFGFIFQDYSLIPILNVEENIKMPALLDGNEPDPKELDEILEMLGLTERRYFMPDQLSGGQKQRVAIGRALMNHPSIIFADEPTGNLDKKNTESVMETFVKAVRDRGLTLILITHEMDIAAMADRIIHLEDGKIISDTTN